MQRTRPQNVTLLNVTHRMNLTSSLDNCWVITSEFRHLALRTIHHTTRLRFSHCRYGGDTQDGDSQPRIRTSRLRVLLDYSYDRITNPNPNSHSHCLSHHQQPPSMTISPPGAKLGESTFQLSGCVNRVTVMVCTVPTVQHPCTYAPQRFTNIQPHSISRHHHPVLTRANPRRHAAVARPSELRAHYRREHPVQRALDPHRRRPCLRPSRELPLWGLLQARPVSSSRHRAALRLQHRRRQRQLSPIRMGTTILMATTLGLRRLRVSIPRHPQSLNVILNCPL